MWRIESWVIICGFVMMSNPCHGLHVISSIVDWKINYKGSKKASWLDYTVYSDSVWSYNLIICQLKYIYIYFFANNNFSTDVAY